MDKTRKQINCQFIYCSRLIILFQQKCVKARALYDNIAEAPDELAFRKGDVLTVLEQNTSGLEGWWLCALRGRQVSMLYTYTPLVIIA